MNVVLVTGAGGFVGRHVVEALGRDGGWTVHTADTDTPAADLRASLLAADAVVHLAGANRPVDPADFARVNTALVEEMCEALVAAGRAPAIVFSSSIQAEADNPYGRSKRAAEERLDRYACDVGAAVTVFRLKNVFGKWSRPDYNSVVATFCHNAARGLPLHVTDPARTVELVYIDDVVAGILGALRSPGDAGAVTFRDVGPSTTVALGDLAAQIEAFAGHRETLRLPDFSERFTTQLYATYLAALPADALAYPLRVFRDARGSLAEFVKSPAAGQIFVSRTNPGVTRGNHYHHTKTEKFLVLEGDAVVRLRPILGGETVEIPVSGTEYRVVDIPPGLTHSVENVGQTELVVLFWASEIFDPARPDTAMLDV